jgi:hypothetical protein
MSDAGWAIRFFERSADVEVHAVAGSASTSRIRGCCDENWARTAAAIYESSNENSGRFALLVCLSGGYAKACIS